MIKINVTSEILRSHLDFAYSKSNGRRRKTIVESFDEIMQIKKEKDYFFVLDYIRSQMEKLLIGAPRVLNSLAIKIEGEIEKLTAQSQQELRNLLEELFIGEYKYFVDRDSAGSTAWCAYTYVRKLNVRVCPYCNSQFIFTYENKNGRGKTRPVLDHFFEKTNFPYLAISIQNLVPCCKVCNSDFKGDTPINYQEYLHPFEHSFDEGNVYFKKVLIKEEKEETEEKKTDYFSCIIGEKENFKLVIDTSETPNHLKHKVHGNKDLFQIEYIYNEFHKSYVQDIILKSRIYNEVYQSQLLSAYTKLFNSKEDLKRILIPDDENADKIILSKLTKDIIEKEINFNS